MTRWSCSTSTVPHIVSWSPSSNFVGGFDVGLPPMFVLVELKVFGCSSGGSVGGDCFLRTVESSRDCNIRSSGSRVLSEQTGLEGKKVE